MHGCCGAIVGITYSVGDTASWSFSSMCTNGSIVLRFMFTGPTDQQERVGGTLGTLRLLLWWRSHCEVLIGDIGNQTGQDSCRRQCLLWCK